MCFMLEIVMITVFWACARTLVANPKAYHPEGASTRGGGNANMTPRFLSLVVLFQLCARQHDNLCASVGMLTAGCQMEYLVGLSARGFFPLLSQTNSKYCR